MDGLVDVCRCLAAAVSGVLDSSFGFDLINPWLVGGKPLVNSYLVVGFWESHQGAEPIKRVIGVEKGLIIILCHTYTVSDTRPVLGRGVKGIVDKSPWVLPDTI